MKIENGLLDVAEKYQTSKKSGTMNPRYLVIHYTAGRTFEGDVRTLSSSSTKASAHIVIGKDGKIAQIGKFTDILWHAGKSFWDGINGLNKVSIGIEVQCEGPVKFRNEKDGIRYYKTWFGSIVDNSTNDIIDARHKNGGAKQGWVQFTPAQLETLLELGELLVDTYNIKEVVGHDMISPGRKSDPGPAMPDNVYAALNGRETDNEWDFEVVGVKTALNVRDAPGGNKVGSVKLGEMLDMQERRGGWMYISSKSGELGWVFSKYTKAV